MSKEQRRPWPMKWVVLAILVFVVGYTLVMVFFRKPGRAYRPYQDSVDRATVARLLDSGFQRFALETERPADPGRLQVLNGAPAARFATAPGGLSSELDAAILEKPLLAASYASLSAPASGSAAKPYALLFDANLSDNKRVVSGVLLYRRQQEVFIVPVFERLGGELQARWRESVVLARIPAGSLPAGRYQMTLVGEKNSLTWTAELRQ